MADFEISVYIILFGDIGFLDDILSTVYKNVKEIIIVDGPYNYNKPILEKLGLYYDSDSRPQELQDIIKRYNIKYYNKVFKNEAEKRIFGYNACTYNNVLLVDADEFFDLNLDYIKQFITSDRSVAGFDIYNMNRTGFHFDEVSFKKVMFKKDKITNTQHLDYTWIFGYKQNLLDLDLIFDKSLGTIYHQTLNRTRTNSIIKYVFYMSLSYENLFTNYNLDTLINLVGVDQLLDIFYHSLIGMIGMPTPDKILKYMNFPENELKTILTSGKYNFNHMDAEIKKENVLIKSVPFFCYPCSKSKMVVNFENVKKMRIKKYEFEINKPCVVTQYHLENQENNDTFNNENTFNNDNSIVVWKFTCLETLTESVICKIKLK